MFFVDYGNVEKLESRCLREIELYLLKPLFQVRRLKLYIITYQYEIVQSLAQVFVLFVHYLVYTCQTVKSHKVNAPNISQNKSIVSRFAKLGRKSERFLMECLVQR